MDTLITIEGADATGKSTVHRGFQDQENDEYVLGLVQRLQKELDTEVHPSREPGAYTRSKGLWWEDEPHINLEPHLQSFERYTAWAVARASVRSDPAARQARDVMLAACFVNEHGSLPEPLFEALLQGEPLPELYSEELQSIYQKVENHIDLLEADLTLSSRVQNTNIRNLLRLAIMTADNEPTATGLLFFAGHVLHGHWAKQKDGIIVSDRAAESQKAYAGVRGDSPEVVDLYEEHQPLQPDLTIFLTCGEEEMARRLKQETPEEDWAGVEFSSMVQTKYKEIFQRSTAPKCIEINTTGQDPEPVIQSATEEVLLELSHNNRTTSPAKATA
jgi:thymidylate kinase